MLEIMGHLVFVDASGHPWTPPSEPRDPSLPALSTALQSAWRQQPPFKVSGLGFYGLRF